MKILGLDLGTNSIGWAVVDKELDEFHLINKGVRIFQEGVKIEKGIEGSKAAERTGYRSARRLKYRRKLRKINTLKVLVKYGYCPFISSEELEDWKYRKTYPDNLEFRNWWLTDEQSNKNPYFFRNLAITEKLDLSNQEHRFNLGRAFYHMTQRRGFLSNRLEGTKDSDGAVKQSIAKISEEKGDKTLGQFFFEKYLKGEKIRDNYTHRLEHYFEEFKAICDFQNLPDSFRNELQKAIFYQRPLRSQKGLVGKCVFETNKNRCPLSRPEFEEFRMLSFINNIKFKTPEDERLRSLSSMEKNKILPLFYRKSKEHFDFEDIAKALAPKGHYVYFKSYDKKSSDWQFNYSMKTTVSACPVSARFRILFGDDFYKVKFPYVREKDSKPSVIDIDDIWHVLFTFDSDKKLDEFAKQRLGFNDEQIREILGIRFKKDYASLSLKAIKKILPYLREGQIYSHAVFLANMEDVLPEKIWSVEENRKLIQEEISNIISSQNTEKQIIDIVNSSIERCRRELSSWSKEAETIFQRDLFRNIHVYFGNKSFGEFPEELKNLIEENAWKLFKSQMQKNIGKGEHVKIPSIEDRVNSFLTDHFNVEDKSIQRLYHPSDIEVYKPPKKSKDGYLVLGSPMINSIRNPMAMRALHQLRKVINELIKNEIIDQNTRVHIEMARDLMNANERKALQSWQREREKLRKEYAQKIKLDCGHNPEYEPSNDEILKYQLWEEQNHKCLYTGNEISLCDFLGANPSYDIEHSLPRSISFDNSQENKTLCDNKFNRSVKRNKIPAELPNHDEILQRIDHWRVKYEELEAQIQIALRQARTASDKDSKDRAIQKRHRLTYEKNYWKNKYERFLMKDVPAGFKNSQLVDTGIITRYARMYLNTYFDKVFTVKGSTVADFRMIWGLQDEYEKKERINHIHHCIDAITMACMTKDNYEQLARFYHDWEEAEMAGIDKKPKIDKPWPTFAEDLKEIENEVLISHYTADNLPKQSKKKLRIRGKIKNDKNGRPLYLQGDTVRGSLHKETNYGAIKRMVTNKEGNPEERLLYACRKPVDSLTLADVANIVDERIRLIVAEGKSMEESLKKELEKWIKLEKDEDDTVKKDQLNEKINLLKSQIAGLYQIPNKDGSFTPIKKVRCIATTVTNPLDIKKHRDRSRHEYKQYSHFANDSNYMMGIYEGKDSKGNTKRDFILINNLDAGKFFTDKSIENPIPEFHPKSNLPLKCILKTGTMVILWENSPEEVWDLVPLNHCRRLYKVIGMSINTIKSGERKWLFGNIALRHNSEARAANDLKTYDGSYMSIENYIPQRKLSHNQFNALVEGYDFFISPIGELKRIEK